MINVISLILQAAIPLINIFVKRSEKKSEMKRKMFEFARKYDEQVLANAKLRQEYDQLKNEITEEKKS